jgi:hypothetical protein
VSPFEVREYLDAFFVDLGRYARARLSDSGGALPSS